MTANSDDIYIKADRNIEVAKKSVTLGDVLKIECVNPAMLARIRSTHLLTFHHPDNKRERRVVMSVLKVIQQIHEIYPEASVENIGETDFIVTRDLEPLGVENHYKLAAEKKWQQGEYLFTYRLYQKVK